jgi:cysteinyl-tRNA synthetase
LGHARTYVATDIIRRILTDHFGLTIDFAMGITDIDDKIINRCKELKQGSKTTSAANEAMVDYREGGFEQLATSFEYDFFEDMDALHVKRPNAVLRVTEHIPEIIEFINTLVKKGFAYATQDGVYFNIDRLPKEYQYDRFGCVPPTVAEIESQENNTYNPSTVCVTTASSSGGTVLPKTKKDPRDFALWKLSPPADPAWDSPWGRGRPGWHIECSTMTTAYFGEDLDIHSGGIDLQFPHHTNEIAQR